MNKKCSIRCIFLLLMNRKGSRVVQKRQVGDKRGMRKMFIKDIFNILLLSHIPTRWYQLSTKKDRFER